MQFPLELRFKILAIAQQIAVTDAQGHLIYYVKQKAFKLKEAVTVFADEQQTRPLFKISADRMLDISARYRIEDMGGAELGILQRRGMRSLWKAHYELFVGGQQAFVIREESAWVRVWDGIVGEIPIVSFFTGYFFHPAYLISRREGDTPLLRVVKQKAFLEGKFRIDELSSPGSDVQVAVLGALMMLLLERARG